MDHLYDELGDLLMQVVLHAELARRHGEFDISDVTTAICQKLISTPHAYLRRRCRRDEAQVLQLWDRNKMAERGTSSTRTEAMRS